MNVKYNICIMRPANYPHSLVFKETADLLMYSLQSLGYDTTTGFNSINIHRTNIIIGVHLLDLSLIKDIPSSSIILNTEPLENASVAWSKDIVTCCQQGFEIWDYNDVNIEYLKNKGVTKVKKLCFGYQSELRNIRADQERDIDVLFYGSVNERRHVILEALENKGLKVKSLFGVYGVQRDEWISRSKIVLDHNKFDYNIFNVVRIFYLLTNSVAVVSEIHDQTIVEPRFREGVIAASYDNMVEKIMSVINDETFLQEQRQRAFDSISKYPQSKFTRALLN